MAALKSDWVDGDTVHGSDQNTIASAVNGKQPVSLPTYVTTRVRSNPYDPVQNVYNWKPENTRKLHASLGRASAGFLAHHAVIGDSITAGYMGDGASPVWEPTKAWPVIYRTLLAGAGIPNAGTGLVPMSDVSQVAADSRWSTTGTWTATGTGYAGTSTNAATATFVSDAVGTAVDVYYYGNGGAFTVNIDGAGAVTPTAGASVVLMKYTVTGLANTTHTVVITASNTTTRYIVGAAVRGATGLVVHNLAEGSSRTATWTPTTAGTLNDARVGALTLSSITPAVVFCELGVNDYLNGVSGATFKTNITTLRTQFSSSDFILVGPPTWNLLSDEMFDLADSLDVPFIDLFSRYGGLGSGTPGLANGLVTDTSSVHPNQACHADWGRFTAGLVAGAGAVGGSGGGTTGATGAAGASRILTSGYGWKYWTYDPSMTFGGYNLAGLTGYAFYVAVGVEADTITNVILNVAVAGSGLTSGQCLAGLYQGGNLLAATADQSSAWTTTGAKVMALTTPQSVTAGIAYVGFFAQGTTPPQFSVAISSAAAGDAVNAGSFKRAGFGTGGNTTAMPSTIGTITAAASNVFAALS